MLKQAPIGSIVSTEELAHPEMVEKLVPFFADGWPQWMPPVLVIDNTDYLSVWDGHHRFEAAKMAGLTEIPIMNRQAMRRGDMSSYKSKIRAYRKKIEHPLANEQLQRWVNEVVKEEVGLNFPKHD